MSDMNKRKEFLDSVESPFPKWFVYLKTWCLSPTSSSERKQVLIDVGPNLPRLVCDLADLWLCPEIHQGSGFNHQVDDMVGLLMEIERERQNHV